MYTHTSAFSNTDTQEDTSQLEIRFSIDFMGPDSPFSPSLLSAEDNTKHLQQKKPQEV